MALKLVEETTTDLEINLLSELDHQETIDRLMSTSPEIQQRIQNITKTLAVRRPTTTIHRSLIFTTHHSRPAMRDPQPTSCYGRPTPFWRHSATNRFERGEARAQGPVCLSPPGATLGRSARFPFPNARALL